MGRWLLNRKTWPLTLAGLFLPSHASTQPLRTVDNLGVGVQLGWTFGSYQDKRARPLLGLSAAFLRQHRRGYSDVARPCYGGVVQVDLLRLSYARLSASARGGLMSAFAGDRTFYRGFGSTADIGLAVDTMGGVGVHSQVNADATLVELSGQLQLIKGQFVDPSLSGGVVLQPNSVGSTVDGRPLRNQQQIVLPRVRFGRPPSHSDAGWRWLRSAREEHSAVAAFLRLARELELLRAPAVLISRGLHAAEDEMLHAMICYERAAHYLRTTVTPEALDIPKRSFASRRAWLSCLANESFWDGYVNEGKAASRVA